MNIVSINKKGYDQPNDLGYIEIEYVEGYMLFYLVTEYFGMLK